MTTQKKNSLGNNYSRKNLRLKKRYFTKINCKQAFNVVSSIQTHLKWEMLRLKYNKDNLRVALHLCPTMLLKSWTKKCIKTQMMKFFREEEHPWSGLLTLATSEDADLLEPMSCQKISMTVSETEMKEKMIVLKRVKAILTKRKAKKMKTTSV